MRWRELPSPGKPSPRHLHKVRGTLGWFCPTWGEGTQTWGHSCPFRQVQGLHVPLQTSSIMVVSSRGEPWARAREPPCARRVWPPSAVPLEHPAWELLQATGTAKLPGSPHPCWEHLRGPFFPRTSSGPEVDSHWHPGGCPEGSAGALALLLRGGKESRHLSPNPERPAFCDDQHAGCCRSEGCPQECPRPQFAEVLVRRWWVKAWEPFRCWPGWPAHASIFEASLGPCLAPRCPWCSWVTSGTGRVQPPAHPELGLEAWGTQGWGSQVQPQLTGPCYDQWPCYSWAGFPAGC